MLIVGGGAVALRKAGLLAAAGARLRVVAPQILPALAQLVNDGGGELIRAPFAAMHLDSVVIVVSAVGDRGIDLEVQRTPCSCAFLSMSRMCPSCAASSCRQSWIARR